MAKIIIFWLGIFLGWSLAVVKPPPEWFSRRIEKIFSLSRAKSQDKLEKTKEKIRLQVKEKFENQSKELEKKLK